MASADDDASRREFEFHEDDDGSVNIGRNPPLTSRENELKSDTTSALSTMRRGLIGRLASFTTPFGVRPLVYADWTASGRAHMQVEAYISEEVLPFYGNTHTTTSITGSQSTCFRYEARQIIAEAVNARVTGRAAEDVVLFTGSGATAAVMKLVNILGLHIPLPATIDGSNRNFVECSSENDSMDNEMQPVVFVGPFEHHSNLLPWRESCAKVVVIRSDPAAGGALDLVHLNEQLRKYRNGRAEKRLLIGSFAAASNVTGIIENVDTVSRLMHLYNGLVFWDYATAAPYISIDFNPVSTAAAEVVSFSSATAAVAVAKECAASSPHKDAVFFSPHKFAGGVNTPGILVVKKRLLANRVPTMPGGGTVFYVTEKSHRYLSNRAEREEGGTPDIIGAVRAGLALRLKRLNTIAEASRMEIGLDSSNTASGLAASLNPVLQAHQSYLVMANKAFDSCSNIVLLGYDYDHGMQNKAKKGSFFNMQNLQLTTDPMRRVPIFSFLVRWGTRFLHYNFIGALLNDLFGVQTRGGCQCAGPYSQRLLGLSTEGNAKLEKCLLEDKAELLRPGYSRFSLPYTLSPIEVEFILSAITFIAERGWLFLPLYRLNHKTGEVKHRSRATRFPERKWLSHFTLQWESGNRHTEPLPEILEQKKWSSLSDEQLKVKFDELLASAIAAANKIEGSEVFSSDVSGRGSKKRSRCEEDTATSFLKTKIPALALELQSRWLPSHDQGAMLDGTLAADMRWFAYPSEVVAFLASQGTEKMCKNMDSQVGNMKGPILPPAIVEVAPNFSIRPDTDDTISSIIAKDTNGDKMKEDIDHVREPQNLSVSVEPPTLYKGVLLPPQKGSAAANIASGESRIKKTGATKYPARPAHRSTPETPLYLQPTVIQTMLKGGSVANSMQVFPNFDVECKKTPSESPVAPISKEEKIIDISSGAKEVQSSHDQHVEKRRRKKTYPKLPVPGWRIMRAIGQAIQDWKMIEDGDRLVVGLSGGKDSLTLLFALLDLQRRAPVKFTISAATINPQTPSFDPSSLIPYLGSLGVTYHFISEPIVEDAAQGKLQGDSLCAYCSRMKRGLLYTCCREHGYNKLVLGQHLDDLAESFVMSALHNGQIRTMKANYRIEAGDVSVIRPLLYVREHQTKDFALEAQLPVINENCPACFEEPKERHRVKKMLAREEALAPEIFANIKTALLPLMSEGIYPYMDLVRKAVNANSDDYRRRRRQGQKKRKEKEKSNILTTEVASGSNIPVSKVSCQSNPRGRAQPKNISVSSSADTSPTIPIHDTECDKWQNSRASVLGSNILEVASLSPESIKWGAEVLAVLPDTWLRKECERRSLRHEEYVNSESLDTSDELRREGAYSEHTVSASNGTTRVMLCNTGKCEMFD